MKQSTFKNIKKNLSRILWIVLGMAAGYLYYRFVGCASGACIITSNPVISTLYGGLLGWLIGSTLGSGGCCACSSESCGNDNQVTD